MTNKERKARKKHSDYLKSKMTKKQLEQGLKFFKENVNLQMLLSNEYKELLNELKKRKKK